MGEVLVEEEARELDDELGEVQYEDVAKEDELGELGVSEFPGFLGGGRSCEVFDVTPR
jgi:hypothetical protein